MILNQRKQYSKCKSTSSLSLWPRLVVYLSSMPDRWKRRVKVYMVAIMLVSACMTYMHYRYLTETKLRRRPLEHTSEILRNNIHGKVTEVKDEPKAVTKEVNAVIKEVTAITKEVPNDDEKYLGYVCVRIGCNGWGDRLIGILTAYVWSIIMDRKFFIMITHPGPLTDVLLPNKVNWNIAVPSNLRAYTNIRLMGDEEFVESIKHGAPKLMNITSKYIAFNNNFDHITPIGQNPVFMAKLHKHGYNMTNFNFRRVLHDIYTELFKLTPDLRQRLEIVLYQAKHQGQKRLVCLQIRIGKSSTMAKDRRHEVNKHDVHKFWEFADSHVDSSEDKIFITTDSETVRNEAKDRYGKRMLEIPGEITHTDWFEPTKASLGMFKLILDFHVLQHCDVIGMSPSGFSALAAYQKRPFEDVYLFSNHEFVLCPDINSDEHCMTRLGPPPFPIYPKKANQTSKPIPSTAYPKQNHQTQSNYNIPNEANQTKPSNTRYETASIDYDQTNKHTVFG
ncbi:unnamed protein product [Owenia fusiformis]|uniref:Uncharacterized protein n=1 Tax=Owenia fusiformis TaxID=6347 RepID=A0A8J1U6V4_OWEFU|nr:unnamed protein product [Owenia fusiformis]